MVHRKEYCRFPQAGALGRGSLRSPEYSDLIRLTLYSKKRGGNTASLLLVHRKEFESLAFGSVDQRSIQLS